MSRRVHTFAFAAIGALAIAGCHSPKGGWMPFTGGSHTYASYETRPATITILDLRTMDEIFTMNVPPGKQLTLDFKDGEGDDPVYNPDLMRYEVFDLGTETGKLRNTLNVPPANARRIDVTYRQDFEYRTTAGRGAEIGSDQIVNMSMPMHMSPDGLWRWNSTTRITAVDTTSDH